MTSSSISELDSSTELNKEDLVFYQGLIGILRWTTELGRTDILHEVSILSQYQAAPREGYLSDLLHIFGYLKRRPKMSIYVDPSLPNVDYGDFITNLRDFEEYYRDAREQLPYDMPVPRGVGVSITAFVDESFSQNKKTRKSHSGFIIFVNRVSISWFIKRHTTMETSTFSAECIAMKSCVSTKEGLRFKLRMFGVPVEGPAHVCCDNQGVVNNSNKVESMLDKKHNLVAYHYVRNIVAALVITVAWIKSIDKFSRCFHQEASRGK